MVLWSDVQVGLWFLPYYRKSFLTSNIVHITVLSLNQNFNQNWGGQTINIIYLYSCTCNLQDSHTSGQNMLVVTI